MRMQGITISPDGLLIFPDYTEYSEQWQQGGQYCPWNHGCMITKVVELNDYIAFMYVISFSIAAKVWQKVGEEDSAVVVERNLTIIKGKDSSQGQAGVFSEGH